MAIKLYDPDNNPDTKPPSLSLSEVAGEFLDTGPHSISEFYRNGGKVPGQTATPSGAWVQGVNTPPDQLYGWIQHTIGISVQPDGITPTGNMFIYWNSVIVYSVSNYGAIDFAKIFSPNQTGIDTDYEYRFSGGGGMLFGKLNIEIVSTQVLYYAVERRLKALVATSLNATVPEANAISMSSFYGTSRAQNLSYTIPALDTPDFVSVSANTNQPGTTLSARISTTRLSFNQAYTSARVTIPAFDVVLQGQLNSGVEYPYTEFAYNESAPKTYWEVIETDQPQGSSTQIKLYWEGVTVVATGYSGASNNETTWLAGGYEYNIGSLRFYNDIPDPQYSQVISYYEIRRRYLGTSGETSSTIANPGVIVYDAAGVEIARQSASGSSGNNTAITVNVPQLQFDTTKTGEFSVAFRADVASNGNSLHAWKSPNINLTVETIV
jgi:hypothetical protein